MKALTAEIRDVVEGIHGRPAKRRGVTTVLAEVITTEGRPGWIAKVKFGSMVVAKSRYAHLTPEGALEELLAVTNKALGVESATGGRPLEGETGAEHLSSRRGDHART